MFSQGLAEVFSTGYSLLWSSPAFSSAEKEENVGMEIEKKAQQVIMNAYRSSPTDRTLNSEKIVEQPSGVFQQGLIASDLGFFPNAIMGTQGVPLKILVTSIHYKKNLCFVLDDRTVLGDHQHVIRQQIKAGEIQEIFFVPEQSGKFRFYCPINNAQGWLIIKERGT